MRCARAVLAVITLLSTPLALLAAGIACESANCTMTCCVTHVLQPPAGKRALCGSAAPESSGSGSQCGSHSSKHVPEFGTIAPIHPSVLDSKVILSAPETARSAFVLRRQFTASGFLSTPFEPPRA